VKYYLDIAL